MALQNDQVCQNSHKSQKTLYYSCQHLSITTIMGTYGYYGCDARMLVTNSSYGSKSRPPFQSYERVEHNKNIQLKTCFCHPVALQFDSAEDRPCCRIGCRPILNPRPSMARLVALTATLGEETAETTRLLRNEKRRKT